MDKWLAGFRAARLRHCQVRYSNMYQLPQFSESFDAVTVWTATRPAAHANRADRPKRLKGVAP